MVDEKLTTYELLRHLVEKTPELRIRTWDGKKCFLEMKENMFGDANGDEWAGFYLEFILGKHSYMGMTKFKYRPQNCKTEFDWIIHNFPADLKSKSVEVNQNMSMLSDVILNDCNAMEMAIKEKKQMYYIILFGTCQKEKDREFKDWKEKQCGISKYVKANTDNNGNVRKHRKLKVKYFPKRIVLCRIDKNNIKHLSKYNQGNQTNKWTKKDEGDNIKRKPKYQINKKEIHHFLVAELDLEPYQIEENLLRRDTKKNKPKEIIQETLI